MPLNGPTLNETTETAKMNPNIKHVAICFVLLPGLACALAPFGADFKVPARQIKSVKVTPPENAFLRGDNATRWNTEFPLAGKEDKAFSIVNVGGEDVLQIDTDFCEPVRTTVRLPLPGDGPANGNVWTKNNASYVSFLCKSTKPAQLTFHLLHRGKSAGTYNTGFSAEPGAWRRVTLPVSAFKLKNFANTAGLGVRVASAEKGAVVSIKDIIIDGTITGPTSHTTPSAARTPSRLTPEESRSMSATLRRRSATASTTSRASNGVVRRICPSKPAPSKSPASWQSPTGSRPGAPIC